MANTNISVISEGQPLTYELINQIISAVNSIKQTTDEINQVIEVRGALIGGNEEDRVVFQAGKVELDFSGASKASAARAVAEVTFAQKNAFSKVPYVTLGVQDPTSNRQDGRNTFITTVVTDLTTKGFRIRARRLTTNANTEADQVVVHYIALGTAAR